MRVKGRERTQKNETRKDSVFHKKERSLLIKRKGHLEGGKRESRTPGTNDDIPGGLPGEEKGDTQKRERLSNKKRPKALNWGKGFSGYMIKLRESTQRGSCKVRMRHRKDTTTRRGELFVSNLPNAGTKEGCAEPHKGTRAMHRKKGLIQKKRPNE